MPVTVIVGGQYGSEGKGKVAHYLAARMKADTVVRVGGPNSGHTVVSEGVPIIFQQLPTAAILNDTCVCIAAGSYIDLDLLKKEITLSRLHWNGDLLKIDPYAVILTSTLQLKEKQSGIMEGIGSTGSGTGAGVVSRIMRDESVTFAKDIQELQPYMADVSSYMRSRLSLGYRVIIEGTQGFGLSLLHSQSHPFVTSRDTTAATFVSEAGLSPLDVDDIVMVLRSFPIRVAGNSGPLENEITWGDIGVEPERTSVTKNIRRVARFDMGIVKKAVSVNNPTRIALNHLDYLSSFNSDNLIEDIERETKVSVDIVGFGKHITFQR